MIEQIHKNQYRASPRQLTNRMDPFIFRNHQQIPPPNRLPMNLNGLIPTNMLQNAKIHKGIGGFASILENLQQVLRVVETTTPLVKEYGPLVKNLPAMYRMLKAFKSMDGLLDETEIEKSESEDGLLVSDTELESTKDKSENIPIEVPTKRRPEINENKGLSTPKLYI